MNRGEIRTTLEAFKWLTCREVLHGAALACRSWYKVSVNDELWIVFARNWGVEPFGVAGSLVRDALREYFVRRFTLALVQIDYAWFFDCNLNLFTYEFSLREQAHIDAGSSNVFLFDGSLLCTGGGGVNVTSSKTYRVTHEGEVTELGRMNQPRSEHGIALFLDTVYVFGGWNVRRLSAEAEKLKMDWLGCLQNTQWRGVGRMSAPRCYFNPCVLHKQIYICGGGTSHCEAFNPQLEVFRPLRMCLPNPYSHHSAVASKDTLFVLSDSNLVILRDGKEEVQTLKTTRPWGNMNGVLVNSRVFLPFGNTIQIFTLAKSGKEEYVASKGIAVKQLCLR